jgi:hypothetical protein
MPVITRSQSELYKHFSEKLSALSNEINTLSSYENKLAQCLVVYTYLNSLFSKVVQIMIDKNKNSADAFILVTFNKTFDLEMEIGAANVNNNLRNKVFHEFKKFRKMARPFVENILLRRYKKKISMTTAPIAAWTSATRTLTITITAVIIWALAVFYCHKK